MSQALGNVNVTGGDTVLGRGGHYYPPETTPTQEPRVTSNFVDGSGPIFSMYLEMATEEDKKMVEGWQADADGILIFTGLFSAAVASLISVSVQDIRPNPQDTSNFYLANIYQTLANPNQSDISSSLPTSPPPFSPQNYAVWVNALLFLSLVISISCALLATLLQQWARRYLKATQPRYSPHKRARIRAFFFEGVDKFLLPWAVEALPTLLHVSLFLFFAGISVFLWNINLTIFKLVLSWIGVCTALYGCITFVPIVRHDSPYHTPLSLPTRHIVTGILYVIFRALRRLTLFDYFSARSYRRFESLEERYHNQFIQGMQRTAEETALNAPSEIDTRSFMWTFDSLDEDHELERFFSGLPGFRSSNIVGDPLPCLIEEQKEKLSAGLMGLLDVTFSSGLLPEPVKDRRAIICAKAFDPAHIPGVSGILDKIWSRCRSNGPMSAEIMQIMSGWDNNTDLVVAVCVIIATTQERDDSWFILASRELGVQEPVLREYAAHSDSLSLAILIYITRRQFGHFWEEDWPYYKFLGLLEAASEINVQDTSPELRHEFCTLWNQITLKARNDDDRGMATWILRPICSIYISLHRDTESAPTRFSASTNEWNPVLLDPSSYPVCNVACHIHSDSSPVTIVRTALDDNPAPVSASLANANALSSFAPAPLRGVNSLTDVPLVDNFRPVHQTTTESLRIPATSPDPATVDAFVAPGMIMPPSYPTSATSTYAFPLPSISPSAAVSLQHTADLPAPSYPPDLPFSALSNPVVDNTLPTESRRLLIATTAPINPPRLTCAADLGATTENDGSPRPGSRKENDALATPSVNHAIHANVMALDLLPQSSPLPLVTDSDVVIAGTSLLLEPYTVRTGDQLPHPPHCPYDIV